MPCHAMLCYEGGTAALYTGKYGMNKLLCEGNDGVKKMLGEDKWKEEKSARYKIRAPLRFPTG